MAIVTDIGESVIANAVTQGAKIDFTNILVGDGGGSVPAFTGAETALVNQVTSIAVTSVFTDPKNPNYIHIEGRIPFADGGYTIREAAALDAEGNLVIIGSYPEIAKPADTDPNARELVIRLVAVVSNTSAITLIHDAAEPNGAPERYNLEAGEDIPDGALVKIGEDGRAYTMLPLSTVDISTFSIRLPEERYQNADLGNSNLIAAVQYIDGSGAKVSFIGYDSLGRLSRLHDAFTLPDQIYSNGSGLAIAAVPDTEKAVAVYRQGAGATGDLFKAAVVDYNGGNIQAGTSVTLVNANRGPTFILHIGEDASSHFYAAGAENSGDIAFFSVSKSDDSIAVIDRFDNGVNVGNLVASFPIDASHFGVLMRSNTLEIYEASGGVLSRVSTTPYTSRVNIDTNAFSHDCIALSPTEMLVVFPADYEFLLDEGKTSDDVFLIARTVKFAPDYSTVSYGDEFRVSLRTNDLAYVDSDYVGTETSSIVRLFNNGDGTVSCFVTSANGASNAALLLQPDFTSETVAALSRSARFAESGFGAYRFNQGKNILTLTSNTSVAYQMTSYGSDLARKGTATQIGINKTGATVLKGEFANFSATIDIGKVYRGFNGLEVGAIEQAGFSIPPARDTADGRIYQVRRLRAISDSVMTDDGPEFKPQF